MTGFFENILEWIYGIVNNYGLAVIIFTLLVRLILLPLDFKSRKGMRAMQKVTPKVQALQEKYKDDRDKLNQKTMELYKKEKVSPTSGCLPLILQMVVLFVMFAAMRNIAAQKTGEMLFGLMNQLGEAGTIEGVGPIATEGFLWIKNIFQPDNFGSPILPTFAEATSAIETAGYAMPAYEGLEALYNSYRGAMYGTGQFTYVKILFITITFPNSIDALLNYSNGLFILPLFAGISQILMTRIGVKGGGQKGMTHSGEPKNQPDPQQNPMNSGFMKWFFPIFSLYICAGYNAAFAVYWAAANIIAIIQQFVLNKYFDYKDKQAAAANPDTDDI